MGDRVELQFRRAAEELLPAGTSVLAAVSGGGDSMALLHLLVRMSVGRPLTVRVAHLDHGLRPRSQTDRRFVEKSAAALGLEAISDRRPVGELRRHDESPEEAARRVRRGFLLEAAKKTGSRWIATGHTQDDQAETVLFRLLRGAGPTALCGIRRQGPGPFVRPLLGIERQALRGFLERHDIPFREDPQNRDLRFDRNRVRQLAIPFLADTLNPRAPARLVAAAQRFREDAECLDQLAVVELQQIGRRGRNGGFALDGERLSALPAPLARRVARASMVTAGVDPRRISTRHLDALIELGSGAGNRQLDLPTDVVARVQRGRIRLSKRGKR